MRAGLLLLGIALIVGGALGTVMVLDPGYVRIEFMGWVAESNVIVLALLLVLLHALVRVLTRCIFALVHSGASVRGLRERYRFGKALAKARAGILEFAAGHWEHAAEQLAEAAKHSSEPVTVWLNAAMAARLAGDRQHMNTCLQEARTLTGEVIELRLLEARWQLEDGNAQQALEILRSAQTEDAQEPRTAGQCQLLMAQAFLALEDWDSLATILKLLARTRGVAADTYRHLEIALAKRPLDALVEGAAASGLAPDSKALNHAWKQVPRHLRNEPALVTRKHEIESLRSQRQESLPAP